MMRKGSRKVTRSKSLDQPSVCTRPSRKRKAEEDPEGAMESSKRKQNYRIENQWVPISETTSITSSNIVPSPEPSPCQSLPQSTLGSKFRFQNYFTTPIENRISPLPQFDWADSSEVWSTMLWKEMSYVRDKNLFNKHPSLHARMRAILLDWLIEVCEVYRLHRETFYLGTDFIDRYLSKQSNIQKSRLQLIGITALFIAAKLEEIYPPKLAEFAYVTDGACTEEEILDQELIMLKAINWNLSPITTNGWLNIYLQVSNIDNIPGPEQSFVFPQYSSHVFVQIARLLDLCILDVECLQFQYSVLAASALYHMSTKELALSVSGYEWKDILPCVQWMAPFAVTVRELGQMPVKFFQNVASEDSHSIQTHVVDLSLLEKVQSKKEELKYENHGSPPDLQAQVITQLTPPQSDKKPQKIPDTPETPSSAGDEYS